MKQPVGRYVIFRCLGHASCCHESMIGRMFLFVKSGYGWETGERDCGVVSLARLKTLITTWNEKGCGGDSRIAPTGGWPWVIPIWA